MRIVTRIENLVSKAGLVAEHGLSIYVETDFHKIIFDTGQSGLFIQNAQKLSISIAFFLKWYCTMFQTKNK